MVSKRLLGCGRSSAKSWPASIPIRTESRNRPQLPQAITAVGTAEHIPLPDAGLEPLYLRRPDAEVPTARKSTLLPPRLAPRMAWPSGDWGG